MNNFHFYIINKWQAIRKKYCSFKTTTKKIKMNKPEKAKTTIKYPQRGKL